MPAFYTPDLNQSDTLNIIEGDEFHHIVHVFRHKKGDIIKLSNGKGVIAEATIDEISKKSVNVSINNIKTENPIRPSIHALFPLLRNKNDQLIVEKLTELGVIEFTPIIYGRTVRTPSKNTVDKFEKVAISAIKQCDNPYKPKINRVADFTELIQKSETNKDTLYVSAVERSTDRYIDSVIDYIPNRINIIIGPEGGYTDREIALMINKNISLITLGKLVLRAETAAICLTSQILLLTKQREGC